MNQIDLNNKVAVVTGGAQGIGLAIAERLVASGSSVCLWDRDEKLVRKTTTSLAKKGSVGMVVMDVTDLESVKNAAKETKNTFGNIDILVCNAGIAGPSYKTWDYPIEEWQKVIDIDLTGVFYCCKAIVPIMQKQNYDIAVNCITPAAAKTRIFDQISENHIQYMLSKIPRNRFLKVDEAASMVAWLCSAENSFTTGGVFDLSGGRSTY